MRAADEAKFESEESVSLTIPHSSAAMFVSRSELTYLYTPYSASLICSLLNHSLYKDGDYEICLFVKDPVEDTEQILSKVGYGGVTRVIGLSELKKEYCTHERRRKLADMFDLFLCDSRITPSMPRLLGNWFVSAKKMPIEVNMSRVLPDAIERSVSSAPIFLPKGSSASVQIGTTKFTDNELVENISSAVKRAVEVFENEIDVVYIKTNRSVALPIYVGVSTPMDESEKPRKVDDIDKIMKVYVEEEIIDDAVEV